LSIYYNKVIKQYYPMKHLLFFFAAMLLTPAAVSAQSGATGNLTWSLSDNGTTLTIRGEGAMPDYGQGESPWYAYREKILTAVIEPGVTGIGSRAFASCDALISVSLPNSLKRIENFAFFYCGKLPSVDIPEGVTAVGSGAFGVCSALTAVFLPSSLTEIGSGAFFKCYSLMSVTIPGSVTEIGYRAFASCSSLSRISVEEGNTAYSADSDVLFSRDGSLLIQYPQGKTDPHYAIPPGTVCIGELAFERAGFFSVEIPGSVTTIEERAFLHCGRLKSLSISRSVTEIGYYAFNFCCRLMAFAVEEGNTSYSSADDVLFNYDGSVLIQYPKSKAGERYAIPPGTVRIEERAFDDSHYLEAISIPEGVSFIGFAAFQNCDNLKSIAIPRSVTVIKDWAFMECTRLRGVTVRWATPLAIGGDVFFSTRTDTLHVPPGTKALYEAATGWKDFKTIVEDSDPMDTLTWSLSDNGTTLTIRGEGAMPDYDYNESPWAAYREKIRTAVIEPGVTGIGEYAFASCTSLTSVNLPNSLKRIEACAFIQCGKLESVSIPEGVTAIGARVFTECDALTAVTIPRSVKSMGDGVFSYCSGLSRISVEEGNTAFCADSGVLFSHDGSVLIRYPAGKTGDRYAIPPGAECIGKWAFEGSALSSVAIPGSVTLIEDEAFESCSRLKSVFIPRSVAEIGNLAFTGCLRLTAFTVEEGNTAYSSPDGVLFHYGGNVLIQYPAGRTGRRYAIPPGTVYIEERAFSDSVYPETVSIPEGVTAIGSSAFKDCNSLKSVSIPRSVTAIESWAFRGCSRLQDVTVRWATPPAIHGSTFSDGPRDTTLHVPPGAKALYEEAEGWKDFKTIVEDSDPNIDL
jgi:hypothetical protein